jgi:predicted RNase H-like HicB family nuclease
MDMKYTIVIEKTRTGFSAYAPDVPGCVAAGSSREEVIQLMSEALPDHIQLMRECGEEVPEPRATAEVLEVAA